MAAASIILVALLGSDGSTTPYSGRGIPAESSRLCAFAVSGAELSQANIGARMVVPGVAVLEPCDADARQDAALLGWRSLPVLYDSVTGTPAITDGRMRVQLEPGVLIHDVIALATVHESPRLVHRPQRIFEFTIEPEHVHNVQHMLEEQAGVVWVAIDFIRPLERHMVPNDPLFSAQWHHGVIGSQQAWAAMTASFDVVIAVLDSGIDMAHTEFASRIVHPRDVLDGDNDPSHGTYDAHGTACAAIAAGVGNNAHGGTGVCPTCKVMPVRIFSESGWGRESAASDGIYWAVDHGAAVINNSWSFAGALPISTLLADAISYAIDTGREGKGAVVVFAAGNANRTLMSYELASHPLVLTVGATTVDEQRATYSNFGATLDLVAPAASLTADPTGEAGYVVGDVMTNFGGTSAAAPVVSGVVGLVLGIQPDFSAEEVYALLTNTAYKIDDVTYVDGLHPYYGHGRISAHAAVMAAGASVCTSTAEVCDDGTDNDCNWLVDAADPLCSASVPLQEELVPQDISEERQPQAPEAVSVAFVDSPDGCATSRSRSWAFMLAVVWFVRRRLLFNL